MSLKKIAEELGLSLTTVSRALNGYPEVAEATRLRVREAADRLGHAPHALARRLATGRADAVGLVLPLDGPRAASRALLALAGATASLLARQGTALLMLPTSSADELATYDRATAAQRVDAFIVPQPRHADPRLARLAGRGMPAVALGRSDADAPWLDVDHEAALCLATGHLLALGHRRFGYLGAPLDESFAPAAHAGFASALRAAGLRAVPRGSLRVPVERRAGYEALLYLLALPEPPTAVLVDNPAAGEGAALAAQAAGRVLGEDLSLVVYGELDADAPLQSAVTCVTPPPTDVMAEALVGLLKALPSRSTDPAAATATAPAPGQGADAGPAAPRQHLLAPVWDATHAGASTGAPPDAAGADGVRTPA